MGLKQRQYKMLVVSAQPKFNDQLKQIFSQRTEFTHTFEGSASTAKRTLLERDYDIIIINSPLPDENGIRLAVDNSAKEKSTVLMLVPNEYYGEVFERVCPHGIFVIPKPMSAQMMRQALDWLESASARLGSIGEKTESLENKMNEIKLVNRAKWILISVHGYSEEQAHRRIEKSAMDRGVKKSVIAEEIIAMNDTE